MRFANEAAPGGSSYGTAVGAWSASVGFQPEKVFGVFRNSYTKTATITDASFVRGAPVILTVASASNNGYDVKNADTAGQPSNDLLVGCVHDYPDTSSARNGVWNPEDYGIVCMYGIVTNAVVANATDSIAAPLMLVPDTGSRFQTIAALSFASASAGTDANTVKHTGLYGLAVLYGSIASSSAAGTASATVFLRCM